MKPGAANGKGWHGPDEIEPGVSSVPAVTPEFEHKLILAISQEDSFEAIEACRRGLVATKSQRNTALVQSTDKEGQPMYLKNGQPMMVPRDSYDSVPDGLVQLRAAEIILSYAHGFPVKRSASIEAHGFVSLDAMLAQSPIFTEAVEVAARNGGARRKFAQGKHTTVEPEANGKHRQ
jgi:hypothetical protein